MSRIANISQENDNEKRHESICSLIGCLQTIDLIYKNLGFSCREYTEQLPTKCKTNNLCDISDANLIADWMKIFFIGSIVDIEKLKNDLFNSKDLSNIQIKKMKQAADRIIGFYNRYNSFMTGSQNNPTEKGKEPTYPDVQTQ